MADAYATFGLSGVVPEAVEVWFQPEVFDPANSDWFVVRVTAAASGADLSGSVGFDGTKVFHDTYMAIYTDSPEPAEDDPEGITTRGDYPANRPDLVDLAVQIARDYYDWRRISSDEVYNGALDYAADGCCDLEVHATADDLFTRASTGPWDDSPEDLFHQPADVPIGEQLLAIITTACPARTGTAPDFTFHAGAGTILNLKRGQTTSTGWTRKIYNGYGTIIPARAQVPMFLKVVQGHYCVGTGDC